jgi:hypothetical protein
VGIDTNGVQREDPVFLRYVRAAHSLPVEPDPQDLEAVCGASIRTAEELAHRYRVAQAMKLIRLYQQWKAGL